jgi:hypothetical protein
MTIARITFYSEYALLYLLGGAAVSSTGLLAGFVYHDWKVALFGLGGIPLVAPVVVEFAEHFRAQAREYPRPVIVPALLMSSAAFGAMAGLAAWATLLFASSARSGVANELTALFKGERGAIDAFMGFIFGILSCFAIAGMVLAAGVVANRD